MLHAIPFQVIETMCQLCADPTHRRVFQRLAFRTSALLAVFPVVILAGCGAIPAASPSPIELPALHGRVFGGQQPVTGARIFLYAAGTTGYASPARSNLSGSGYVTTDSSGSFTITGSYTCQPGDLVYLVASGGNPGLGPATENAAMKMMAALGPCSSLSASTFVNINEVSTIASVWALSPFMVDATHLGVSNTNTLGLANAFSTVGNVINTASGSALNLTPAGNGIVPQAKINTLANILSSCVNSDGTGTPCSVLMSAATDGGGNAPTDTLQAALNIAQHPIASLSTLYNLQPASAPFQPSLSAVPTDFTLFVSYSGGCIILPMDIAVDSQGGIWIPSSDDASNHGCVAKLSTTGSFLSGPSGFTGGTLSIQYSSPTAVSIDLEDNAWISNRSQVDNHITKLRPDGTILSGSSGFIIGQDRNGPWHAAVDSNNNVWLANPNEPGVAVMDPKGNLLTPSSGYTGSVFDLAIDGSGNIWGVSNASSSSPNFVIKMDSHGVVQSGPSGFPISNFNYPHALAIDHQGNVWIPNLDTSFHASVIEMSSSGTLRSGVSGFTHPSLVGPRTVAVDGLNRIWIANSLGLVEMKNDGTVMSGPSGFLTQSTGADTLAVDGSGNVWVVDYPLTRIIQFIGVAAPVVTPLAVAAKNNALGELP